MDLQRLLQILMATMAALGTLMLGMGQRDPTLPLVVSLVAFASVWCTDITGWFRISRRVGNLLALLVVAVLSRQLLQFRSEAGILGIADLLVYLQIILLLQHKDTRVYWELATLSLLQVVIAAAFYQGFSFGLVLLIYMPVGFSSLTLIQLDREASRYGDGVLPRPAAIPGRRWPLAGQTAVFTSAALSRGTTVASGLTPELLRRLARLVLGTLAVTMLLFLTVPRLGGAAWRGPLAAPHSVVGFSKKVTLGKLGETIESEQDVLRVRFVDAASRQLCHVESLVYLQGALLLDYAGGEWKTGIRSGSLLDSWQKEEELPLAGLVRQECVIEPLKQAELFAVTPLVAVESSDMIFFDVQQLRLLRDRALCGHRFSYVVGTTALVDGVQKPVVPGDWIARHPHASKAPRADGPGGLPNLVGLANQWIADSGLPSQDRFGRAKYLERMFTDSTRFEYSLRGPPRDPSLDPIEDFIVNNPVGHCEYFATALTLMLRSQGIPARMIVGYKCDEWNDLGKFYQVRQLHAHAWVEAYLEFEQIPRELLHGRDGWDWSGRGAWLRLDPTPASMLAEEQSWIAAALKKLRKRVNYYWSNYVVEMDRARQQEAIYQPLARAAQATWCWLRDWLRGVGGTMVGLLRNGLAGRWLAALSAVAVVLGIAAGIAWLPLRRWRRTLWLRRAGSNPATRTDIAEVAFYHRFEVLLAQHGLVRRRGQTPQELAAAAGRLLQNAAGRTTVAALPSRVVAAFYQVRFGRQPLDSPGAQAVEHALEVLSHENWPCRVPGVGQEHVVRVADGHEAGSGDGPLRAERHGLHPGSPD